MHAVHLRSDAVTPAMSGPPGWMHVNVHHARRSFMIALDGISEFVFHTQLLAGEDEAALTGDDVRRLFADCMGREIPFDILFRASWTAGFALVAERFRPGNSGGRLFLAGDAAHLFTPMGGLGYNTAVEDAVNLGWKLAAVLAGWGGGALLESYERERKPAAVRNTGYARAFADSLGNFTPDPRLEEASAAGEALRAEAGAYFEDHGRREFNIPGITFGTRIDGSPIVVPDGTTPPPDRPNEYIPTACPGGRPPHAWLADGSLAVRPLRLRLHPARSRRRSRLRGPAAGRGPHRRPAADPRRPAANPPCATSTKPTTPSSAPTRRWRGAGTILRMRRRLWMSCGGRD